MADQSDAPRHLPERRRPYVVLYAVLLVWIAIVAGGAFLLRGWVAERELAAYLDAAEKADTAEAILDGPAPRAFQSLSAAPPESPYSGSIYIPVYKSVYVGGARSLNTLSATLSVRNTSANQAVVVSSIQSFGDTGIVVADLLAGPHVLPPMATAEFYIDQSRLGSDPAAAIVVTWDAETPVAPLLAEAVIVGSYGAKSISFISRGESRP